MRSKGILTTLLTALLVVGFLGVSSAFVFASHEGAHPGDPEVGYENLPPGPDTGGVFLDTVDAITDWVFAVLMLVAVIYLVLAAYQFITGGGDPQKVSEARQKLLYAVIGIGLALAANGVDNVLTNIIG